MAKTRTLDDIWFVQRPEQQDGVWYDVSGPFESLRVAELDMKAMGDGEYRIARIQRWQNTETEEVIKRKKKVTDMMPKALDTTPEPEATPDPNDVL